MKIYFEDYFLDADTCKWFEDITGIKDYIIIDASVGYKANIKQIEHVKQNYPNVPVLTNQTALLDSEYGYKEEEHCWDIYLYSKEHKGFVCIEDLTDKLLRRAHNIERLYRAGFFDED